MHNAITPPAPPTAHSLHHHTLCSPPDLTPAPTPTAARGTHTCTINPCRLPLFSLPAEPAPAAPAPPASANVHTSSHPTAPGESPRAYRGQFITPPQIPRTRGTHTCTINPCRLPPFSLTPRNPPRSPPPRRLPAPPHPSSPPDLTPARGTPRSPHLCYRHRHTTQQQNTTTP